MYKDIDDAIDKLEKRKKALIELGLMNKGHALSCTVDKIKYRYFTIADGYYDDAEECQQIIHWLNALKGYQEESYVDGKKVSHLKVILKDEGGNNDGKEE